jgi:hypothetical protein
MCENKSGFQDFPSTYPLTRGKRENIYLRKEKRDEI